jgi:DNA-binding YbaB/EbfC family protein
MNIAKMMKQAQEMQAKIGQVQAQMEAADFLGTAGGSAVKLTLSGKGELKNITIDASLLNADDKETLEDLIVVAHKAAKEAADSALASAMGGVTGGLNLPAGMKRPF